jgi:hypothetical protein
MAVATELTIRMPPDDVSSPQLPTHSEDGVDLTLIRWMLSLTPVERLETLQQHVNAMLKIRAENNDG